MTTTHHVLRNATVRVSSNLDDKISRKAEQIARLDERIGRLMSKRVDLENELAALYEARRARLSVSRQ